MIISFILMTLICSSGMILYGEIRWWSLLGVQELTASDTSWTTYAKIDGQFPRKP